MQLEQVLVVKYDDNKVMTKILFSISFWLGFQIYIFLNDHQGLIL